MPEAQLGTPTNASLALAQEGVSWSRQRPRAQWVCGQALGGRFLSQRPARAPDSLAHTPPPSRPEGDTAHVPCTPTRTTVTGTHLHTQADSRGQAGLQAPSLRGPGLLSTSSPNTCPRPAPPRPGRPSHPSRRPVAPEPGAACPSLPAFWGALEPRASSLTQPRLSECASDISSHLLARVPVQGERVTCPSLGPAQGHPRGVRVR